MFQIRHSARLIAGQALRGRLVLRPNAMPVSVSGRGAFAVRAFSNSNDTLRDAINKINKEHEKKAGEEAAAAGEGENASNSEGGSNSSNSDGSTSSSSGPNLADTWRDKLSDASSWLRTNFELAWDEMTGKSKPSALERKVHQAESYRPAKKAVGEDGEEKEEEETQYDGPTALVLVKDPVSAWERMKDRLKDSPLIKEILKNSKKIGDAAVHTDIGKQAQRVGQNVKDKLEDAREIWETSQNPIIYTLSGVWENLTGTTEEGQCIAQIRKLDPSYDKEAWATEVRTNLTPLLLRSHLSGDTKALKPWCGEAVYNKLAADIRARKGDGISFDTNILDIFENAVILKELEDHSVCAVIVYSVQQINCIRNKEGEIVEGAENDIRMKYYHIAYQQHYDEDTGIVSWKCVDYQFAGDIPYI